MGVCSERILSFVGAGGNQLVGWGVGFGALGLMIFTQDGLHMSCGPGS